jgi:hypothetical protein
VTRKLRDAEKEAPATAKLIRDDINRLYAIEREADEKRLDRDGRGLLRQHKARPILAASARSSGATAPAIARYKKRRSTSMLVKRTPTGAPRSKSCSRTSMVPAHGLEASEADAIVSTLLGTRRGESPAEGEAIMDPRTITQSVVRVDGETQGTGYLARQDLVISVAHVSGPVGARSKVFHFPSDAFGEHEYAAETVAVDAAEDCAVMRLEKPIRGVVPIPAARSRSPGETWWAVGFPRSNGGRPFTYEGSITNPSALDDTGRIRLQLYSDHIAAGQGAEPHGASGSPAVTSRGVVGILDRIITDATRAEAGTVYAYPLSVAQRQMAAIRGNDRVSMPLLLRKAGALQGTFVLGALDPDVDILAAFESLTDRIKNNEEIDHFYLYLGPHCAKNWIQLTKYGAYGHNITRIEEWLTDSLVIALRHHFASYADPADGCTVISLGCGDGHLDTLLLQRLIDRDVVIDAYLPVDMSFELLQQTVRHAKRAKNLGRLPIHPIYGDITNLNHVRGLVKAGGHPDVLVLFGYTMANYERAVLGPLAGVMGPEDCLLVDARCYEQDEGTLKDKGLNDDVKTAVKKSYQHRQNEEFAFGPLANFTRKEMRGKFGCEISLDPLSRVANAVGVTTRLNLDEQMRIDLDLAGTDVSRLTLARSRVYRKEDLLAWFRVLGLRPLVPPITARMSGPLSHCVFVLVKNDA